MSYVFSSVVRMFKLKVTIELLVGKYTFKHMICTFATEKQMILAIYGKLISLYI